MPESTTKQDTDNLNDPQKKNHPGTVSKNISLEGLNPLNGAPTSPLVQTRTKTHRCLAGVKDPQPTNAPSPRTHKPRYKKSATLLDALANRNQA